MFWLRNKKTNFQIRLLTDDWKIRSTQLTTSQEASKEQWEQQRPQILKSYDYDFVEK